METEPSTRSLSSLPCTAANHFRLRFFEAVARVRDAWPEAEAQLPFLAGYYGELDQGEERDCRSFTRSREAWEARASRRLPVLELARKAGLDDHDLALLFAAGLIEEDHRFAAMFEVLQGPGQQRPTLGLLSQWVTGGDARTAIPRLIALGLVEVVNPTDPRMTWSIQVSSQVWDALRGAAPAGEGLRWIPRGRLPQLGDLILSAEQEAAARAVAGLLQREALTAVLIRGPESSGRRTLAGAFAHALGQGVIALESRPAADMSTRCLAPLAVVLDALPLVTLDLAPGETFRMHETFGALGPVMIVLGNQGGVEGRCVERAVTLSLDVPEPEQRDRHWASALNGHRPGDVERLASRHRMTGGNIRRTATLALAEAALESRSRVGPADVRRAARTLTSQLMDRLARRVPVAGDWGSLALAEPTMSELRLLERRCRHRERLAGSVGAVIRQDLGAGVRALFSGPSGTGKTLAARTLAGVLDVDLYRLDLSMVVDKYIGETEKNLSRIFARAEEADVALLLDEGDALLTKRTAVESSHDRYANLETNYLLQRLESFDGILIVTTNAGERIDTAFRRRMDAVIDFYPPDPLERWSIWQLHLPDVHNISPELLEDLSSRCALTGGQIRNAVLHAALLALHDGREIDDDDLRAAVSREYGKAGEVCPLPEAVRG